MAATDVKNDANLSTNLEHYWELEEASGTRVDSHASADISPTNTPGSATGKQGDGVDFESSQSEYLSSASSVSTLSQANDFSIAFWWKPESVGANQMLVIKRDNDDANVNYRVYMDTDGKIRFFASDSSSAIVNNITSTTVLSAGTWYHIVAIKSSTNGGELYIDNTLEASDGTATADVGTNTDSLRIGTRLRPSAQLFADGVVDELVFWSKELSSTERSDLYNSGSGIPYDAGGGGGGVRNSLFAMGGL